MAKKLIDILSDAAVVRDETNEKANTAERVGGVLVELANYLSAFAPVSNVTVEADGANVRLVLHLKNEDGTVSTRGVSLPAATTSSAGVLTSELLKALQAADKSNEDLAKEGISKAESASAMLFAEEAARKEADLSLNDLIEAEVTERLQSVATETAARKAADDELRGMADEGLSKADAALSQIHEERQERAAQDRTLAEAVSQERTERTTADAELSASISAEEAARTQRDAELTAVLTAETNARLTADRDEKEARKTADDTLSERITSEAASREASDAELQAKIQDHEDRIWKLENQWYGIEWDTEVSSPAVTRIGNMDLHRTLPIQSRMRGCLLDDNGKVVKYLNPKDWTGEVRDGSRGQVMVEIPMHYRRCETDGTKRRVKLSEFPLPDYHQVPRMYVSAYEASLQRSTKKLCSVVNTDPDFRGGDNNAAWDGTYRSLLGRPATNINRTNFRTYARNRNNAATAEWNQYTYHVHKAIYWLYVVEYANRNSQLPFTAELTAEGFHQGGLGEGVSNFKSSEWYTFNKSFPFVPCGHTDSLGNSTGVVAYTAYNADGTELKTSYVPRYRGIENPFGHIFKWADGINVRISPTEENGGDNLSKVFVCEDPYLYNDTNYNCYKNVGNESRTSGYTKDIIFGEDGEIIPSLVGGGSTEFFCDFLYTNIPTKETLCVVMFCGKTDYGLINGLAFMHSSYAPSILDVTIGTRLCFLPAE